MTDRDVRDCPEPDDADLRKDLLDPSPEIVVAAMRAFEPFAMRLLRYPEADRWHLSDVEGMRQAIKAAVAYADAARLADALRAFNEAARDHLGTSRDGGDRG